ncbi:hypothetical protein OPV22_014098 [Ensete ventricosum]|uniref:Uncharacterized protein n=1 Tax=Ensete ventricosum TaxID=4639 RepID=A0AAV8R774_ENSVE|nr:hypothetical protein OPV22_014098 [Ensete ventricosum]
MARIAPLKKHRPTPPGRSCCARQRLWSFSPLLAIVPVPDVVVLRLCIPSCSAFEVRFRRSQIIRNDSKVASLLFTTMLKTSESCLKKTRKADSQAILFQKLDILELWSRLLIKSMLRRCQN